LRVTKSLTLLYPLICLAAGIITVGLTSCGNQPAKVLLRVKHDPVGKTIEYKLDSHRVGSYTVNGEKKDDFDTKIEAEIIYTTQKLLGNGYAMVLEKNIWHSDEPVNDSGKVKRVTKEYAYDLQVAPTGKVIDFAMEGEHSVAWENYARNFYEQGIPVFPAEAVPVGYKWTQTSLVVLQNKETVEAKTTYRIKGTATKMGYNCAIIEYKGNLILPILPDPSDTTGLEGLDNIEMNGILYFAIDAGMSVSSEERRRSVSKRKYNKDGTPYESLRDMEEVISYALSAVKNGG